MKKLLSLLLIMVMVFCFAACGQQEQGTEETWPAKDITIVVPYSAGGGTDITCRALQSSLSNTLGVNVIITNEPASSGTVGAQSVADAAADGYTFLCSAAGAVCYQNHYESTKYDLEDFTPIARVSVGPELIAVRDDSGINTYEDLVAAMKANKLSVASTAVGAAAHVAIMSFAQDLGVEINYVPYSSGNEAMVALLGGQVDICVGGSQQIVGQLAKGGINVVANLGSAGGVGYEDVTIVCENGCKTCIDTFNGIVGPAGLDQAIVDKMVAAVETALKDQTVLKALEAGGIELGFLNAAEFKTYLEGYNETVHGVLESIGLI